MEQATGGNETNENWLPAPKTDDMHLLADRPLIRSACIPHNRDISVRMEQNCGSIPSCANTPRWWTLCEPLPRSR